MKRKDPDILPTEAVFAVAYTLTRRGALTVVEAADLAGTNENGARRMLNKASRKAPITTDAPGRWIVTDETADVAERVRPVLQRLRDELQHTPPGLAFCRPFTRRDTETLLHALEILLCERA